MDAGTLVVAGLSTGSLYALVALGLVLLYKTQDVVNFAHGEILMVGAFIGYTAYEILGLPYLVSFAASVVLGGVLGAIIERTAFRRMARQHHITLAMVTVGLSFALKGAARIPFGGDIYTFPPIFGAAPPLQIHNTIITPSSMVTIAAAAIISAALFAMFAWTKVGKQMRATQQNMTGARIVGINTGMIFSYTWALAAAIGAAAGMLAAPVSFLYPDMGADFLLKGFAAAVLGGFDSVAGAVVGGLLVGLIEILFGAYVSTAFQHVSAFVIIIVVMFFRPHGLFGRKPVHRV